mgnify:CR=1 FL=1
MRRGHSQSPKTFSLYSPATLLPQRDMMNMKKKFEIPDIRRNFSQANKLVTLSGSCHSRTYLQKVKAKAEKERQKKEMEDKRMTIIQ